MTRCNAKSGRKQFLQCGWYGRHCYHPESECRSGSLQKYHSESSGYKVHKLPHFVICSHQISASPFLKWLNRQQVTR